VVCGPRAGSAPLSAGSAPGRPRQRRPCAWQVACTGTRPHAHARCRPTTTKPTRTLARAHATRAGDREPVPLQGHRHAQPAAAVCRGRRKHRHRRPCHDPRRRQEPRGRDSHR
jgi:hypothetical protein